MTLSLNSLELNGLNAAVVDTVANRAVAVNVENKDFIILIVDRRKHVVGTYILSPINNDVSQVIFHLRYQFDGNLIQVK